MKGFIEEYGKIIVVIILTLLMLGFGQTGLAKPLQNSLLKSTGMITNAHNKFDEVTKGLETVTPGAIIDIEGTKYVVLEERENNQALVMRARSIGDKVFQSTDRSDGQNKNTYEGSEIDNYLENDWYNSLSSTMKAAIQTTNIKQALYRVDTNPDSKYDSLRCNVISRHAFLPSVSEIGKVVDLKNPNKVKLFLNKTNTWTRDMDGGCEYAEYLNAYVGKLNHSYVKDSCYGIRPAFVINLSKVDYKVTGHTDYK